MRRALLAAICTLALAPAPAGAAFDDPFFIFTPTRPPGQVLPPPLGYLDGPCGMAVDSTSRFYIADYYHRVVDLYSGQNGDYGSSFATGATGYVGQLAGLDPLDGPCQLALDSIDRLYVNEYHRGVVRYGAWPSFGAGTLIAGVGADGSHPTGVAVDTATDHVYVDERDRLAEYDAGGAFVQEIGAGAIADGYGVAVSAYPGTSGYVYIPDAATDTVKVFDPATDTEDPVEEITGPPAGFKSLHDSAIAVDNTTGEVYVLDTLGAQDSERPQATVYVFDSGGTYKGRLKRNVVDGGPSGLAVDNSASPFTRGRVYVTSGISQLASIYAYRPGSATSAALPPLGITTMPGGSASALTSAPAGSPPAAAASTVVSQQGALRVSLEGKLHPRKLPREGTAPISVSVGGQIATTDGSPPPVLETLSIEINREGRFDTKGLDLCPIAKIQPASTKRALSNCRSSLVGEGSFTALVGLGEQETYETAGRLLLFNAEKKGKPVLYGQIYASSPFATSFVIPFELKKIKRGSYGTLLSATLPPSLRSWGNLTAIEMTLSRRYGYEGEHHSYISAGCPAPKGFGAAVFPLVRSTFSFSGDVSVTSTLTDQCKVRG
jgi:hypothetical protein